MAQTLSVNSNNDLFVDFSGNIAIAIDTPQIAGNSHSGPLALIQICAQAAKTLLGELIYQIDQGLPNFQTIWTGVPNIPQWELAFRTAIEEIAGVTDVSQLTVTIANGALNYIAIIETIYGIGEINGSQLL